MCWRSKASDSKKLLASLRLEGRGGASVLAPRIQPHLKMLEFWKACWVGHDHRGRGSLKRARDSVLVEPLGRYQPKKRGFCPPPAL